MDNNLNDQTSNNDQVSQNQSSLIKGSVWMTAGSIFSRILGAIYIIPWNNWFGTLLTAKLANSLFAKGYNIYSLFLIISTAGIPGAISKQIAHYNAKNEYAAGNKLFRHGLKIMSFTGIVTAALMFFLAPWISAGNKNLIPVLQALSFALLIIPIMSIMRGYFQGYNQMAPSAISQFVEQVARVIYMLAATYIIMKILKGSYVNAVVQSTFAAFIGAIFGLGILIIYLLYKLPILKKLSRGSKQIDIDTGNLTKEIWSQALPFIILDSGIIIFQLFDQYTFNWMMGTFSNYSQQTLDAMYALFGFNANKLIMIVVSLASAMAVAAVPLLSAAHARHNKSELNSQDGNTIQLFLFVMIPAALGMYAVAEPLYILFYRYDGLGILMLQFSSIVAILLGLFTVVSAMLQGLYQNQKAINYFVIGFVVKMLLQYPAIYFLKEFGPLAATAAGMVVSSYLMLRLLYKKFGFNMNQTINRFSGIVIISIIMLLVIMVINYFGYQYISVDNRVMSVALLIVEVIVGIAIYGYLTLKIHLAEKILGSRVKALRIKLGIK